MPFVCCFLHERERERERDSKLKMQYNFMHGEWPLFGGHTIPCMFKCLVNILGVTAQMTPNFLTKVNTYISVSKHGRLILNHKLSLKKGFLEIMNRFH